MPKSICPCVIHPYLLVYPYVCVHPLTFVQPARACAFRARASVYFNQHIPARVFRTHTSIPASHRSITPYFHPRSSRLSVPSLFVHPSQSVICGHSLGFRTNFWNSAGAGVDLDRFGQFSCGQGPRVWEMSWVLSDYVRENRQGHNDRQVVVVYWVLQG